MSNDHLEGVSDEALKFLSAMYLLASAPAKQLQVVTVRDSPVSMLLYAYLPFFLVDVVLISASATKEQYHLANRLSLSRKSCIVSNEAPEWSYTTSWANHDNWCCRISGQIER